MLNIIDLLGEKGITVRKVTSSEYGSMCPNCGGVDRPGDYSDRFRTKPDFRPGGSGWCRQCGWSGDNIQFCRDFLGLDFKDACDHVGRAAEKSTHTPRQLAVPHASSAFCPTRPGLPRALWQQRAAELVDWAHKHLLANAEQLAYLAGRGINLDSVRRFRLGYNPGEHGRDIYRPRETWGLAQELKDDGTPKKFWIPRGLVIPVYAPQAGTQNPVLVRIRRPKEHLREGETNKYIVLPGSTNHTFVTDPEARAFVVVEAYLDAMLISQAMAEALPGAVGAVALGSLAHKPDGAADELLGKALAVLVALDFEPVDPEADPKKATNLRRIYAWWPERYPRAERWPVPQGKDPGDAYTEGCDIASWVTAGLPPVLRLKPTENETDGPCSSGGRLEGGAVLDVPFGLSRAATALAHHMSSHGITLRRTSTGGLLLPVAGDSTASSAMDEMIFLIPDDLAVWLKGLGLDEVTAEMLGGGRG